MLVERVFRLNINKSRHVFKIASRRGEREFGLLGDCEVVFRRLFSSNGEHF